MSERKAPVLTNRITGARRPAVAIVGFTDHRLQAPFGDPRFECWGLNELYRYMPLAAKDGTLLFHRWFELHPRSIFEKPADQGGDPEHIKGLAGLPIPVYMLERHADIPPSLALPKQYIEDHTTEYMTSSIAWMLGLAIAEGFEEIHLYGVDMAQDTEYCLAPETRVLGADLRWRTVGDVRIGEKLIAFDEEPGIGTNAMAELTAAQEGGTATAVAVKPTARQWRVATVEAAVRLRQPCYRITLDDGTTIVSSDKHRWLTRSENDHRWRATKDLVTPQHRADRPTKLVRVLPTWTDELSYERGYLAAAFDGEGSLGQNAHSHCNGHSFRLQFAQKDNAMAAEVRRCLAALGFKWSERMNVKDVLHFILQGGRSEIMRFLGTVQPKRLMAKFAPENLGSMQRITAASVVDMEFLGEQDVIGLQTSEGTFIAEGFASHNSQQRPCVEYLLGIAQGMGIKIAVPPTSDLLKCVGQYGYESQGSAFMAKLAERSEWLQGQHTLWQTKEAELEKEFQAKSGELRAQYEAHKKQFMSNRQQVEGAIDDCRYWQRSWGMQTAGAGRPATPDRSLNSKIGPADAAGIAAQPRLPAFDASRPLVRLVETAGSDGPNAESGAAAKE